MTNRNRLLYALVLLPTLLLTSCYKDFNKVRVKPFKPDLVVPLATADNITFEDMLVGSDYSSLLEEYSHRRIGLKHASNAIVGIGLMLKSDCDLPVFAGDDELAHSVLTLSPKNTAKIIQLTFKPGATLKADKDVQLPLADGAGVLDLKEGVRVELSEEKVVDFSQMSEDAAKKATIKVTGIDSGRVKVGKISEQKGSNGTPTPIKVFKGLLWYSGELTDLSVVLEVERMGWISSVKVDYWFDNFYLETKQGDKQAIVGTGGNALPFNKDGESGNRGTLEANADIVKTQPYPVNTSNLGALSKEWPLTFYAGRAFCKPVEGEAKFEAGKPSTLKAKIKYMLPITGRFNALVREFKPEDDSTVSLPDVNSLLQDSGRKGGIKSRFTKNDTVLLHFYFKNATPMDIYLAAKIGGNNKLPKGEAGQKASVIEGLNSRIDDEALRKDNKLKIGDFEFFKAVGGADVEEKEETKNLGLADKTKMKSKEVTIEIPYEEYERARTSIDGRQLRALLLFRSPNGTGQKPIVVSPRLDDYVSIRLGVEVKPEVSIELINKE